MPDRAALPRSLALADLRREPQVQRAADAVAANVEQPEDAFPALPFALFHQAGCDDALAVEIFELALGVGANLFDRSEQTTSALTYTMHKLYAVFCLKKI